jgi:hypothetical protein
MTEPLRTRLAVMKHRRPALVLLVRVLGALAMVGTLTGSLVVSCDGDPLPATGDGGVNAAASIAMGQWTPATQDTCTKAFHDTFFVVGPDGKKYPTWHRAEETDPTTNQKCSFGHDHGADPSNSALWPALQQHFAFDANNSGNIEASELAVSGIPFGLVSQQLANSATPRLEDHTAYKIAFANGIARTLVSGGFGTAFDLRCDLFAAFNQPTSTADAFASNMFSVTYAVDCNNGNSLSQYPVKVIVSLMAVYGNPGTFTLDASGTLVEDTGIPAPPNSPPGGTELGRRIPVGGSVFAGAFVAANQTSSFDALMERWDTQLRLRRSDGSELATLVPAFRVDDTARYFFSGLANSVDLCYSGLNAAGQLVSDPSLASTIVRQVRNNAKCAAIAPSGPSTPIPQRVTFDAAASPFKDCVRTAFFGADVVRNRAGATIWYTTPFGDSANIVSFANSVKQFLSLTDTGTVVLGEANAAGPGCQIDSIHVPN